MHLLQSNFITTDLANHYKMPDETFLHIFMSTHFTPAPTHFNKGKENKVFTGEGGELKIRFSDSGGTLEGGLASCFRLYFPIPSGCTFPYHIC